MGTLWVPIWSKEALWAPAPLMGWVGHPPHMGTQRVPIIGRDLFSFLLVARPLAFGSLPAPMGTHWVPICTPRRGVHYKRVRVKRCHPSGDNPFGVNFGLNYRDLGHNLRLILFFLDFTGHTSWASMGTLRAPIWVPLWGTQVKIMDLNQYLDRMNTKTIII